MTPATPAANHKSSGPSSPTPPATRTFAANPSGDSPVMANEGNKASHLGFDVNPVVSAHETSLRPDRTEI